jgi:hypothetical protein
MKRPINDSFHAICTHERCKGLWLREESKNSAPRALGTRRYKSPATLPSQPAILVRIHKPFSRRCLEPRPYMFPANEMRSNVLGETQVLFRWHDAEGVGVAHATSPTLHTDYSVTTGEDTELDGVHNTPRETLVNIFLPWSLVEVGLLFVEEERIHSTIEMRVLFEMLAQQYLRMV